MIGPRHKSWWAFSAFAAVMLVLTVVPVLLKPWQFVADDPYYYLQVAYNIMEGEGSTFSRVTPTNGYHPLWVIAAIATELATLGHRLLALRLVIVLDILLTAAVAIEVLYTTRRLGLRYPLIGLGWLVVFFTTGELYGSEAYLSAALLVALPIVLFRACGAGWVPWLLAGLVSAGAVLARLDNVFVVAALDGAALLGVLLDRRGGGLPAGRGVLVPLAGLTAAGVAVVGPYLLWNFVKFGHLMPISGAIKGGFPDAQLIAANVPAIARLFVVAAVATAVLAWVVPLPQLVRLLMTSAAIGYVAQVAYAAYFVRFGATWYWYYVPGALLTAYALVLAFQVAASSLHPTRQWLRWLEVSLVAVLLVVCVGRAWGQYQNSLSREAFLSGKLQPRDRYAVDVAAWLDRNLPEGSGVYAWDWAGTLGYYSDMRVLPVDGLINDYAYAEDIVDEGVAAYLEARDVDYYLGPAVPEQAVVSPLTEEPAGVLELGDARMVARIIEMSDAQVLPDWALYRLDGGD